MRLTLTVQQQRARVLWRCPLRKLVRGYHVIGCWVWGHPWGPWRVETEDWFEHIEQPVLGAWRMCISCRLGQHITHVE